MTPPLFHTDFVLLFPLDYRSPMLGSARAANQPWNYFRSIPVCEKNILERYRRTDGWETVA